LGHKFLALFLISFSAAVLPFYSFELAQLPSLEQLLAQLPSLEQLLAWRALSLLQF